MLLTFTYYHERKRRDSGYSLKQLAVDRGYKYSYIRLEHKGYENL